MVLLKPRKTLKFVQQSHAGEGGEKLKRAKGPGVPNLEWPSLGIERIRHGVHLAGFLKLNFFKFSAYRKIVVTARARKRKRGRTGTLRTRRGSPGCGEGSKKKKAGRRTRRRSEK